MLLALLHLNCLEWFITKVGYNINTDNILIKFDNQPLWKWSFEIVPLELFKMIKLAFWIETTFKTITDPSETDQQSSKCWLV